jgi:RHH-type proline utilization regulon transcriptional repressor/proline dehydrogenase/delta 1-pyrroline-5-carboxylate dehydrogenase
LPGANDACDRLSRFYHADETEFVGQLLAEAELGREAAARVSETAQDLVRRVRRRREEQGALEAFMQEYDLSSEEGVVLMCLAEALLRIPDADTAEVLIADKLSAADWESHLGKSSSVFVNASTWGLMLTGKLVRLGSSADKSIGSTLGRMVNRSGEPVIRSAIRQAMRIMGFQYVMGRSIEEALERAERKSNRAFRYSFDMLGEAALTAPDAERYFEAYCHGIRTLGKHRAGADIFAAPSISVKLSALHPRYGFTQRTVDAEEADRLLISLDVFAAVLRDPGLKGWDGFGVAIQTYLKMAGGVIDLLTDLARETGHRLPVRLVKGAYWDAEIKHAQVEGFDGYPVFTRKTNTDVSFIACARRVLARRRAFYPQFATHNAHTIAVITELAGQRLDYEFQRLHGMGKDLYGELMNNPAFNPACRVYAPVGSHEDLLPYLVRRLLENGSNTSFVNRIVDEKLPVEEVAEDPVERVRVTPYRCLLICMAPHAAIPQVSTSQATMICDCSQNACSPGQSGAGAQGPCWPITAPAAANGNRTPWRIPRCLVPGWARWNSSPMRTCCRRCQSPTTASLTGTVSRRPSVRRPWTGRRTCSRRTCPSCWPCSRGKPVKLCTTGWPKFVKQRISSATTPCRHGNRSTVRRSCPARRESTTR